MREIEEVKEALNKLSRLLELTPNDINIKIQKETLEWVLGKSFNAL